MDIPLFQTKGDHPRPSRVAEEPPSRRLTASPARRAHSTHAVGRGGPRRLSDGLPRVGRPNSAPDQQLDRLHRKGLVMTGAGTVDRSTGTPRRAAVVLGRIGLAATAVIGVGVVGGLARAERGGVSTTVKAPSAVTVAAALGVGLLPLAAA